MTASGVHTAGEPVVVFISHAGRDRAWAEWVAWELDQAGYAVELALWGWAPGENFVEKMRAALDRCHLMVALFSSAYFEPEEFSSTELAALFADRTQGRARVVPVKVEQVSPPKLYRPLITVDLFGQSQDDAQRRLINGMTGVRRPSTRPPFPSDQAAPPVRGPRLPGVLPQVWKVPPRSTVFTGRDRMLVKLREDLLRGGRVLVQALYGVGGVGKTQLALEYAHRFAGEYDLVWWIASEQPELIGEQFAALATRTNCTDTGATMVMLQSRPRVLLIFDNAESRDDLTAWLPGGSTHVLVTSRNPIWTGVAATVSVDVFARAESVALLNTTLPQLTSSDANRLAEALGDLPLAISQAADLLLETGLPLDDYLAALSEHANELLRDGSPAGYPAPLAAAVTEAATRLHEADPAAGELLTLCAYLAPEPIPLDLFTIPSTSLPPALAAVSGSSVALHRTAGRLIRFGLARATPDGPQLHRLTQAILRDTDPDQSGSSTTADRILVAARPDNGTNPASWPNWRRLLPHILARNPAATDNKDLRWLAYYAGWHLFARGDPRSAFPLATQLYEAWKERHGPDDPTFISAMGLVARAHRDVGQYAKARVLDEDAFERNRRILGNDHHDTLTSATDLARDLSGLGEHERARDLNQDTLSRRRRILGENHRLTLTSANNHGNILRAMGEYEEARAMNADTLDRRRQALGDDDVDTLQSANNFAADLRVLNAYEQARDLDEDTLRRRRRTLGDDHPLTLNSKSNLALGLRALGEFQKARELDEDTLERRRRVLGENHPETRRSAENLAEDLRLLGEN